MEPDADQPPRQAQSSGDAAPPEGSPVAISEWVRRQRPDLQVLGNTDPDPVLLQHNLVAFAPDPATGRDVALAFERTRTDHAQIGTVVVGSGTMTTLDADADMITRHAARRAAIGALIGAVVFAVVIGGISWLLFGGAAAVIGGAIGGALFGAGSVATWSYVIGTGQSPAYRESFVDPSAVSAVAVSVHANDTASIDAARAAITDIEGLELHRIDAAGQPIS